MDPLKTNNQRKKQLNNYAKYSSIGIQMLVIILAGVFGGYKLDQWLELSFPAMVLVCASTVIFLAIYTVVKDLLKK